MKVRELIDHLSSLSPELDVVCLTEDTSLVAEGQLFRLLDITAVTAADAERTRTEDRAPYLRIGKGPNAETLAIIQLTSDF